MITVSGRQLIGSELINVSPMDHPVRTVIFLIPFVIFTWYSLQFFRNLEKGVTLAMPKTGWPLFKIFPGKVKKQAGYRLQHYDNSLLTGILGLIFFATAEFFLVIMFKSFDYTFL